MIIAEGSGQTLMVTPASIAPFTFDESAAADCVTGDCRRGR